MASSRKLIKYPETSIIIRTKNEEMWLGIVLERLREQTYQDFEIIIVDSGSDDKTLKIAKEFQAEIVEIPYADFSYPHASNVGCQVAKAKKYFVFLSGHSIPVSNTWLEDGIENFSKHDQIMGVYGPVKALPKSVVWDKLFISGYYYLRRIVRIKRQYFKNHGGPGIMGFTNAIIYRELWDKHHFDEKYGSGGEDGEWADYWFNRGFKAIKDLKFTVLHSHNLSPRGHLQELKYWLSLGKPSPFKPLSFRKDRTHRP